MGLTEQVQGALRHLYERWDGKGLPGDLRGEQVPLPVRVMQVAQDADVAWQRGGPALARRKVRGRAGSGLDPQVAAVFCPSAIRYTRAWMRRRSGRRRWPPSRGRGR